MVRAQIFIAIVVGTFFWVAGSSVLSAQNLSEIRSEAYPPHSEQTLTLLSPQRLVEIFSRPPQDAERTAFENQVRLMGKPVLEHMAEIHALAEGGSPLHPVFQIEDLLQTWDPEFRDSFLGDDFDIYEFEDAWHISEVSEWSPQQKALALHAGFQTLLNDAAQSDSPIDLYWHHRLMEEIEESPERIFNYAQVSANYAVALVVEVEAKLDGLREDIQSFEGVGPSPRMRELFESMRLRPHQFEESGFSFARMRDFALDEGEEVSLKELAYLKSVFDAESDDNPEYQEVSARGFGADKFFADSPIGFGILDPEDKQVLSDSRMAIAHEEYERRSRAKANSLQTWGVTMGIPVGAIALGAGLRYLTRAQSFQWGFARQRATIMRDVMKSKPSGATRAQIQSVLSEKSNSKYRQRMRQEFPGAREDFKQQMNFARRQDQTHQSAVARAERFFGAEFAAKYEAHLQTLYEKAEAAVAQVQTLCADDLAAAAQGGQRVLSARGRIQRHFIDQGGRRTAEVPNLRTESIRFAEEQLSPNRWSRYRPRSRFRRLGNRAANISGRAQRRWYNPFVRNARLPQNGSWGSMVPGEGLGRGLLSSATRKIGSTLTHPVPAGLALLGGGVAQYYQSQGRSHRIEPGSEFTSEDPLWLEVRSQQPTQGRVIEASIENLRQDFQGEAGEETSVEMAINQERATRGLGPIDLIVDGRSVLLGTDGRPNVDTGRVTSIFVWMKPRVLGSDSQSMDAETERLKNSWVIVMNSNWENSDEVDATQAGEISWRFAAKAPLYRPGDERHNRKARAAIQSSGNYLDPEATKRLFRPIDFFIEN